MKNPLKNLESRPEDGFVNITKVASGAGVKVADLMRRKPIQQDIQIIEKITGLPAVHTINGKETYAHPLVALDLLSFRFPEVRFTFFNSLIERSERSLPHVLRKAADEIEKGNKAITQNEVIVSKMRRILDENDTPINPKMVEHTQESAKPRKNKDLIKDNSKISMGDFSKMQTNPEIKGRNKMFAFLRKQGILKDGVGKDGKIDRYEKNVPVQKYIDAGYFSIKIVEKNGFPFKKTFVTKKGQEWLRDTVFQAL